MTPSAGPRSRLLDVDRDSGDGVEDRDRHPGRVWSRLTRAQRYVVVELYGARAPVASVDPRTAESMARKKLIEAFGGFYVLTDLGEATAAYRLSLGVEGLHHRLCDGDQTGVACLPVCPVYRYQREHGA